MAEKGEIYGDCGVALSFSRHCARPVHRLLLLCHVVYSDKKRVELSRLRSLLCCGYRRMRARGSTGNNGGADQAASHQPAAAAILAWSKTLSYHSHCRSYCISCACRLRAFCHSRAIGRHMHSACRINQCRPYSALLVLQAAQHAFIIVSDFCAERGCLAIV